VSSEVFPSAFAPLSSDLTNDLLSSTEDEELWRACSSAPDYEVSSLGRVRRVRGSGRIKVGRPLSQHYDAKECAFVNIFSADRIKRIKVHTLVCRAFHGEPPASKRDVIHKDGCRRNNQYKNLAWGSRKDNIQNIRKYKPLVTKSGRRGECARLSDEAIATIRRTPRRTGLIEELAEKFQVSRNLIATLRCKTTGRWPHIPFQ
jgi:hypothetical protein